MVSSKTHSVLYFSCDRHLMQCYRGIMPVFILFNESNYFDKSLYPRHRTQALKSDYWAAQYYSLLSMKAQRAPRSISQTLLYRHISPFTPSLPRIPMVRTMHPISSRGMPKLHLQNMLQAVQTMSEAGSGARMRIVTWLFQSAERNGQRIH